MLVIFRTRGEDWERFRTRGGRQPKCRDYVGEGVGDLLGVGVGVGVDVGVGVGVAGGGVAVGGGVEPRGANSTAIWP
jgi:hypothetical protein